MSYFTNFIYSFFATLFFSCVLRAPKKTLFVSSLLGGLGYVLYMASASLFNQFSGFFISSIIISICCEILARVLKAPSIILLFPAVIPLVPGLGLYEMMFQLVKGNINIATHKGVETIIIILIIASSMAVTNLVFRSIKLNKKKKTQYKNPHRF